MSCWTSLFHSLAMVTVDAKPWLWSLTILLFINVISSTTVDEDDLVKNPRHLKPFGYAQEPSSSTLDEVEGFPFTQDFFQHYVKESKPLLMKNAAKLSKAFNRWTDEYFLSANEPADSQVLVESGKKENRDAPGTHMSFKDFVRSYNNTDTYLVESVPQFLAPDVVVPTPLQCEILAGALDDAVMWFSSGGTKSVVHTDSYENINCLFRGEKELVLVDPAKYKYNVDIDRRDGSFSLVDVDKVDLTKYPGLANVEYINVKMVPGDCFYIPWKWIHHVRSTGSNIAVNVWWDYDIATNLDIGNCPDKYNPDITLDKIDFKRSDDQYYHINEIISDLQIAANKEPGMDFKTLVELYAGVDEGPFDEGADYTKPLSEVFGMLDRNKDATVSREEVDATTAEEWDIIANLMRDFEDLLDELDDDWKKDEL